MGGIFVNIFVLLAIQDICSSKTQVNIHILRSELGGESTLRCSHSNNTQIKIIQWKSGENKERIFYDSATQEKNTGPRGRFKGRNVTGRFNNMYTYHELHIKNSTIEDETMYHCEVRAENFAVYAGCAPLHLIAQPKDKGSIKNSQGETLADTNCSDMNSATVLTMEGETFLICEAGASRPPPEVQWQHKKYVTLYNRTKYHEQYGTVLFSSSQKIDLSNIKERTLERCTCIVKTPDPVIGKMVERQLCIFIMRVENKPHKNSNFVILILIVVIFVVAAVMISLFAVYIFRHRRRHLQRRQADIEPEVVQLLPQQEAEQQHIDVHEVPAHPAQMEDGVKCDLHLEHVTGGLKLDLSFCRLSTFPMKVLQLPQKHDIVELDLSHNSIKELPNLTQLNRMKRLYLQYCNLETIQVTSLSNALEELNLEGNGLSQIPDDIQTLKELKVVNVSENPVLIPKALTRMSYDDFQTYLNIIHREKCTKPKIMIPALGTITDKEFSTFVTALTSSSDSASYNENVGEQAGSADEPSPMEVSVDINGAPVTLTYICCTSKTICKAFCSCFLRDYGIAFLCLKCTEYNDGDLESLVTTWLGTIYDCTWETKIYIFLVHNDLSAQYPCCKVNLERIVDKLKNTVSKMKTKVEESMLNLKGDLQNHYCKGNQDKRKKYEQHLNILRNNPAFLNEVKVFCSNAENNMNEAREAFLHAVQNLGIQQGEVPEAWLNFHKRLQQSYACETSVSWQEIQCVASCMQMDHEGSEIRVAVKLLHHFGYILLSDPSGHTYKSIHHDPHFLFGKMKSIFDKIRGRVRDTRDIRNHMHGCFVYMHDLMPILEDEIGGEKSAHLMELFVNLDICTATGIENQVPTYIFPFLLQTDRPDNAHGTVLNESKFCISLKLQCMPLCPLSYFHAVAAKFYNIPSDINYWEKGLLWQRETGLAVQLDLQMEQNSILVQGAGERINDMWQDILYTYRTMKDMIATWPCIIWEFHVLCPLCVKECKESVQSFSSEYLTKPFERHRVRCLNHACGGLMDRNIVYPPVETINRTNKMIKKERDHTLYVRLDVLVNWYGPEMLREILFPHTQPFGLRQWIKQNIQDKTLLENFAGLPETTTVWDLKFDELVTLLKSEKGIRNIPRIKAEETTKSNEMDFDHAIESLENLHEEILANPHDAVFVEDYQRRWNEAEQAILYLGGDHKKINKLADESIDKIVELTR